MASQLFTIGYEGTDIKSFILQLKENAVECLLDVREIPFSRKRGFSKTALAKRLSAEHIRYLHFKELGSPKNVREKLKQTRDYEEFFNNMDAYLAHKKESIESAYHYVRQYVCCLMCFERQASQCHRTIVAKRIKERDGNGLQIKNI